MNTPEWIWRLTLDSSVKLVLLAVDHMADTEGATRASTPTLARLCGLSNPTVTRALARLTELQIVSISTSPVRRAHSRVIRVKRPSEGKQE